MTKGRHKQRVTAPFATAAVFVLALTAAALPSANAQESEPTVSTFQSGGWIYSKKDGSNVFFSTSFYPTSFLFMDGTSECTTTSFTSTQSCGLTKPPGAGKVLDLWQSLGTATNSEFREVHSASIHSTEWDTSGFAHYWIEYKCSASAATQIVRLSFTRASHTSGERWQLGNVRFSPDGTSTSAASSVAYDANNPQLCLIPTKCASLDGNSNYVGYSGTCYTTETNFGAACDLTCPPDASISPGVDSQTVQCDETTAELDLSTAQPCLSCSSVSLANHGGACASSNTKPGDTCQLDCPAGEFLSDQSPSQTLQCNATGHLETPSECFSTCAVPTLESKYQWSTSCTSLFHGSTCAVTCNTGNGFSGASDGSVGCNDGTVDYSAMPDCFADCPLSALDSSYDHSSCGVSLVHDATCSVSCESGYAYAYHDLLNNAGDNGKITPVFKCKDGNLVDSKNDGVVPVCHQLTPDTASVPFTVNDDTILTVHSQFKPVKTLRILHKSTDYARITYVELWDFYNARIDENLFQHVELNYDDVANPESYGAAYFHARFSPSETPATLSNGGATAAHNQASVVIQFPSDVYVKRIIYNLDYHTSHTSSGYDFIFTYQDGSTKTFPAVPEKVIDQGSTVRFNQGLGQVFYNPAELEFVHNGNTDKSRKLISPITTTHPGFVEDYNQPTRCNDLADSSSAAYCTGIFYPFVYMHLEKTTSGVKFVQYLGSDKYYAGTLKSASALDVGSYTIKTNNDEWTFVHDGSSSILYPENCKYNLVAFSEMSATATGVGFTSGNDFIDPNICATDDPYRFKSYNGAHTCNGHGDANVEHTLTITFSGGQSKVISKLEVWAGEYPANSGFVRPEAYFYSTADCSGDAVRGLNNTHVYRSGPLEGGQHDWTLVEFFDRDNGGYNEMHAQSQMEPVSAACIEIKYGMGDGNGFTVEQNAQGILIAVKVYEPLDENCDHNLCGDGVIQPGETCDDRNKYYGDGCNADCTVQVRHVCTPQWLISNSYSFTTTDADSCLLQGTQCGDGFIDNSAYFHRQQQYRRVPYSNMNSSLHSPSGCSDGTLSCVLGTVVNVDDIINPDVCATANPNRNPHGSHPCNMFGGATVYTINFKNDGPKSISKLIIDAADYGYTPGIYAELYSDASCTNEVKSIAWADWTQLPPTYSDIYGHTIFKLEGIVTPQAVSCILVRHAGNGILISIKVYEAVGHAEECDGETYCDQNTCQLLPSAKCDPLPAPLPRLVFSAKQSLFEYNSMYSGMMLSVPGYYDHWPRLVASDSNNVIAPSNVSNKVVLSGFNVKPAGEKLLIGTRDTTCDLTTQGSSCAVGTWTAIIKLSDSSTNIATFLVDILSVDNGRTLELVYQHGDNTNCPDGKIPGDEQYAENCPRFILHCTNTYHCNLPSISATYTPKADVETLISVAFTETNTSGRAEINFGDATADFNDVVYYGSWLRHTATPSDRNVYLQEIHISTFEYLTMSAIYEHVQLRFTPLREQLNHQDTYGAGRECAVVARNTDGVKDSGEDCDDGNLNDSDGCSNSGIIQSTHYTCANFDLWSGVVKSIELQAEANTHIEEVQFFDVDGNVVTTFTTTGADAALYDQVWNTPGEQKQLYANPDGAVFTFTNSQQQIEYIRIYNSRHASSDTSLLTSLQVIVTKEDNDKSTFVVGYAVAWNGDNNVGGCSDTSYPCFVDLVHNATQSRCDAIQCSLPLNPPINTYTTCTDSLLVGETCTYNCSENFFEVEKTYVCTSDGTLLGTGPTCVPTDVTEYPISIHSLNDNILSVRVNRTQPQTISIANIEFDVTIGPPPYQYIVFEAVGPIQMMEMEFFDTSDNKISNSLIAIEDSLSFNYAGDYDNMWIPQFLLSCPDDADETHPCKVETWGVGMGDANMQGYSSGAAGRKKIVFRVSSSEPVKTVKFYPRSTDAGQICNTWMLHTAWTTHDIINEVYDFSSFNIGQDTACVDKKFVVVNAGSYDRSGVVEAAFSEAQDNIVVFQVKLLTVESDVYALQVPFRFDAYLNRVGNDIVFVQSHYQVKIDMGTTSSQNTGAALLSVDAALVEYVSYDGQNLFGTGPRTASLLGSGATTQIMMSGAQTPFSALFGTSLSIHGNIQVSYIVLDTTGSYSARAFAELELYDESGNVIDANDITFDERLSPAFTTTDGAPIENAVDGDDSTGFQTSDGQKFVFKLSSARRVSKVSFIASDVFDSMCIYWTVYGALTARDVVYKNYVWTKPLSELGCETTNIYLGKSTTNFIGSGTRIPVVNYEPPTLNINGNQLIVPSFTTMAVNMINAASTSAYLDNNYTRIDIGATTFDEDSVYVLPTDSSVSLIYVGDSTVVGSESDACGDGRIITGVEECDDGNSVSGDGCSSSCTVESAHICDQFEVDVATSLYTSRCITLEDTQINLPAVGEDILLTLRAPQFDKTAKRLIIQQQLHDHFALEYLEIVDVYGNVLDLTKDSAYSYTNAYADVTTEYSPSTVTYKGDHTASVVNLITSVMTDLDSNANDGWIVEPNPGSGNAAVVIVQFQNSLRIETIKYRFRTTKSATSSSIPEYNGVFDMTLRLEFTDGSSIVRQPIDRNTDEWSVLQHTPQQLETLYPIQHIGNDISIRYEVNKPISYVAFKFSDYNVPLKEIEFYEGSTKIPASEYAYEYSLGDMTTYSFESGTSVSKWFDGDLNTEAEAKNSNAATAKVVVRFTNRPYAVTHIKLKPVTNLLLNQGVGLTAAESYAHWTFSGALSETDVNNDKYEWEVAAGWENSWKSSTGSHFCAEGCNKYPTDFTGDIMIKVPHHATSLKFMSAGGQNALIPFPFTEFDINIKNGGTTDYKTDESVVAGRYGLLSSNPSFSAGLQSVSTPSLFGTVILGSQIYAGTASTLCGDALYHEEIEGCDDGNLFSNDGCSSTCTIEDAIVCTSERSHVAYSFTYSNCYFDPAAITCGDGVVSNNMAFYNQMQYSRIPFSALSTDTGNYNKYVDPDNCAASGACSSENDDVIITITTEPVLISQLIIFADAAAVFTVKMYNSGTSYCPAPLSSTVLLTIESSQFSYDLASGSHSVKLAPSSIDKYNCVLIDPSAYGTKGARLYQQVGHREECDSETYCDPTTCQLLPTAYCTPRPAPVPTMIFSAKRSLFEFNVMYSGLVTYVSLETQTRYPHLEAINEYNNRQVIKPTQIVDEPGKWALTQYDVRPASILPLKTWTAWFKFDENILNSVTKQIAIFDNNLNPTSGNRDTYDYQLYFTAIAAEYKINFVGGNGADSSHVSVDGLFTPNTNVETFLALVFDDSVAAQTTVTLYAATEDTAIVKVFETTVTHVQTYHLSLIRVSNLKYLTVTSLYDIALSQAQVTTQFEFQDEYGAGRNCTEDARNNDGVFDLGEQCDDGNTDSTDGCHNGAIMPGFTCNAYENWGNSLVSTVAFANSAQIEEVIFYDSSSTVLKPSSISDASKSNLHDGVWNLRGETQAGRSSDINGVTFTFSTPQAVEYIRLFNSRLAEHDGNDIANVEVTVNGAANSFSVGHSSNGEWTCNGDCSSGDYPGYVDLTHNANQSTCDGGATCISTTPAGDNALYTCADQTAYSGQICTLKCEDGYTGSAEQTIQCIDGSSFDAFTTLTSCTPECGDGQVITPETCDDGNSVSGDGCSNTCQIEDTHTCVNSANSPTACSPTCGDGQRVGAETAADKCDEGGLDHTANIVISGEVGAYQYYTINNQQDPTLYLIVGKTYTFDRSALSGHPFKITNAGGTDVVSPPPPSGTQPNTFTFTPAEVGTYTYVCTSHSDMTGSIIVQAGNGADKACGETCTVNTGYAYDVNQQLAAVCGDGNVLGAETCDDSNTNSGDGCSSSCQIETGYSCSHSSGSPSVCSPNCGDGQKVGTEQCDDFNTDNGDGCSSACQIEPDHYCNANGLSCSRCSDLYICDAGKYRTGCGMYSEGTCAGSCNNAAATQYYTTGGGLSPSACGTGLCTDLAVTKCPTNGQYLKDCGLGVEGVCEDCTGGDTTLSGARYITGGITTDTCAVGSFNDGNKDPAGLATDGSGLKAAEACDNGNKVGCVDGIVQTGYDCSAGTACTPICGDNLIKPSEDGVNEQCDDGPQKIGNGDGCSSTCTVEIGYSCNANPCTQSKATDDGVPLFTTNCGDNAWAEGTEQCDDGNTLENDGCTGSCEIQEGYGCQRNVGDTHSTCRVIVANAQTVLYIDPTTGCSRLTAPQDTVIDYRHDEAISALQHNRSLGGNVDNCFVCDNQNVTIIVPEFDAAHVLANMPVFKGSNCLVQYAASDAVSYNSHMCPPFQVGDARMTANEECDDGNTASGDGCSSAGELEDAAARASSGVLRYQAINTKTMGDGFITHDETYDTSDSLTNSDLCKGTYVGEQCGRSLTEVSPGQYERVSIATLSSYEVVHNGWKAPVDSNDKFAYFEMIKSAVTNEYHENLHIQVLQQHPALVPASSLVQTTNARRVVIQCVKSSSPQSVLTTAEVEAETTDCSGKVSASSPQCKLSSSDLNSDIFVAGQTESTYDTQASLCGQSTSEYNKIRVYVLAEESGNVYVKHTVRSKGSTKVNYIDYPSLLVLNFRAHVVAADISAALTVQLNKASMIEKNSLQTISGEYAQTVQLDKLSDAKFVRTVRVLPHNAERYDDVTYFTSPQLSDSKQDGIKTMYFGAVADGEQIAKSVFSVPAYENSPAQLGLLSFDAMATLFSCDQYDGAITYSPEEQGSVRADLAFESSLSSTSVNAFSGDDSSITLRVSPTLERDIHSGQNLRISTGSLSKTYSISAKSSTTVDIYNYATFTLTLSNAQGSAFSFSSSDGYTFVFSRDADAGKIAQFISSADVPITSEVFDVTKATEDDLTYQPSSSSISEGSNFVATFTWQRLHDESLTRTWKNIECCDVVSSATSHPDYAVLTSEVNLEKFDSDKCFRLTSQKQLYETDARNAQLTGSGIQVRVTPCEYATVAVTFQCRVRVIEPIIQNSLVPTSYQDEDEASSRYQYDPQSVAVNAIVQQLNEFESFNEGHVFVLQAGSSSTVDVKVCTYVNDLVRNSPCDESEYVDEAKLLISGLKQNQVNGNSYWVAQSFLNHGNALQLSGSEGLVKDPTFDGASQTECFTTQLSASSQASTCGTSNISIIRSHAVKEDSANAYEVSKTAWLKIDELSCAPEIEQLKDMTVLEEDYSYSLKDFYRFKRGSDASCGKHEKLNSIKFTVTSQFKDNVLINGQTFDSNGELTLDVVSDVEAGGLGDMYLSDWKNFTEATELSFSSHFNTKSQPTIDLSLEIEVVSCDGADPKKTTVSRKIAVEARNDECYQDAVNDAVESSYRVKAGNVIPQLFNATLSHLDERRFYQMKIRSNVPLSYQISRINPLQRCGTDPYGSETECILYCSPDGSEPTGATTDEIDAMTLNYWDENKQCKYLKDLLIVPYYDESLPTTTTIDGLPFNCDITKDADYCSAEIGGTAQSRATQQPFNGFLYLQFSSSIAVESDINNRKQCNTNNKNLHFYDIEPSQVIGEARDGSGNEAVSDYDSALQVSRKEFFVSGSDLNNGVISLALKRADHSIYKKQENGMYVALSITSNNCKNEDGDDVEFSLNNLEELNAQQNQYGFNFGINETLTTNLIKQGDASKHVIGSCTIVIDAEETGNGAIFAPFFTSKAQFVYRVEANLGDAVVQLGTVDGVVYTPFDTGDATFSVYFKRTGGSDGILQVTVTSDVSECPLPDSGTPSSTLNGLQQITLTWPDGNEDILSATVGVSLAADCAIRFVINGATAQSQIEGRVGETWLTGNLGTLEIAYSDNSAAFASTTLLLGATNANGQEFKLLRTKYEKVLEVDLSILDAGIDAVIVPSKLSWHTQNDATSRTFRVKFNNKAELETLSFLRINAQMTVPDANGDYTKTAGGQRLLTDANSQQIPIVNDLSGSSACQWGSISTVQTVGSVSAMNAQTYSAYIDSYVRLSEGAQYFVGPIDEEYTLQISRPAQKEGTIKFRLAIAVFDYATTGIFSLTNQHLEQKVVGVDNGYLDFGSEIEMSGTTTSVNVVIKAKNDQVNNGINQLGLLYVDFEPMRVELPPELSDDIVTGCNANAAANTALSKPNFEKVNTARRLLEVITGRGDTTILKVDDDVDEPFRQVQTSEDFSIEYWSNATLLTWDAAMTVEMQFDVPNYGDQPFGAWAQIGKCPENVDTMFTAMSTCSTFKPLLNGANLNTITYVRQLVGLDPAAGSKSNCTGQDWPCEHRYSIPDSDGFNQQSDMSGKTISLESGVTRPVYPYKYSNSLTELEDCLDYEGNKVVDTASSDGDTAYTFKTCIVTYHPRFADRSDSDVILKTAEQTVMLSSTNEAVVTAIMFETSESIKVSMIPRQKSCLSSDSCYALSGYDCDSASANDRAFLELETVIDVPIDYNNEFGFTGPVQIQAVTEQSDGGCHWFQMGESIVYSDRDIAASVVHKTVDGSSVDYARVSFSLRTPCFSARRTDGSVASNMFSTCPAASQSTNYDFKVQMGSCKTEADLNLCAKNENSDACNNCVLTGNRQTLTVIKSSVNFVEQLPSVNLGQKTAMQLVPQLFKYGSSVPVEYTSNVGTRQSFTTKDTLVLGIRPATSTSFEGDQFALTCPDKYLAAYNPISAQCTTSQAVAWTYTPAPYVLTSTEEQACDNGQVCVECENHDFPLGLAKQSVLFDGARKIRICENRTHVRHTHTVAMLDYVHTMWLDYYENDWRANPDNADNNCQSRGTCRVECGGTNEIAQVEQGCYNCKNAGAFGAGRWVLPILAATPLVRGGQVTEQMASLIVDGTSANVQVCKHEHAKANDATSFGSTIGFDQHNVCNGTVAKEPRYCGFPGLTENDQLEFSPNHEDNPVYVSAGISLFCGALLPGRLYSISAHCYITNCQAENSGSNSNYVRRLLQFADEHDVVVDSVQEDRHTPAAGAKFFKVEAEPTTPTATNNEVAGLGSTIAITLGVVALVVIALMSVSWIYMYRRVYGANSALPMHKQHHHREPLLHRAAAQQPSWNF